MVQPFAALIGERFEFGRTIFELNAGEQFGLIFRRQFTNRTHCVFALHFVARVHEPIGQTSRRRKEKQSFGIEVKTANRNPTAARHARKVIKDARAAFRVVTRNDFARGLMVKKHTRRVGCLGRQTAHETSFNADHIFSRYAIAEFGRVAVHRHDARFNQALHFAPRPHTGIGKRLLQLFRRSFGAINGRKSALEIAFSGFDLSRQRIRIARLGEARLLHRCAKRRSLFFRRFFARHGLGQNSAPPASAPHQTGRLADDCSGY